MHKFLLLMATAFFVVACQSPSLIPSATSQQAVAMPDSYSADVAIDVLNAGGNAIDAAIAAQFVLAVTLPEAGNIGGGGLMTAYINARPYFLDYRETAPASAHRDMYLDQQGNVLSQLSLYGAKASGVPGTVAGMWAAHQRFGSLPWSTLLAPAIRLAEEGFIVHPKLAKNIEDFSAKTQSKQLKNNFADYFATATANSRFVQPELAQTLKQIQLLGRQGFYQGEVADKLVAFMRKHDGLITANDLKNYEAKWREPIVSKWRGYDIITAPPPSSGGVAITQWLGMLERFALNDGLPQHNSAEYLHIMSEIGKRVFADRAEYLGDPDFIDVPVAALTRRQYLAQRVLELNQFAISDTPSVQPGLAESEDTTHFSIVDQYGNAVANTTTLNLTFGSGMVVEGAGFLLNDEMDDFSAKPGVPNFFGAVGGNANAIAPNKRMLSSMTPTLVLQDSKVKLVTGSPGGTTILSSVVQSVINALWFDMSASDSVNSPRFHHQLYPKDTIRVHPGFSAAVLERLAEMGYVIDPRRFGDIHLIKVVDGKLDAASEASGRGKAIVTKGQ